MLHALHNGLHFKCNISIYSTRAISVHNRHLFHFQFRSSCYRVLRVPGRWWWQPVIFSASSGIISGEIRWLVVKLWLPDWCDSILSKKVTWPTCLKRTVMPDTSRSVTAPLYETLSHAHATTEHNLYLCFGSCLALRPFQSIHQAPWRVTHLKIWFRQVAETDCDMCPSDIYSDKQISENFLYWACDLEQ